ncbi:hypothetical protein IFM89_029501 [Coptis chinensis]|uniref:RING-type E3 ubiquitin transferase BRCA1 n=1 Tax=Coptis chinensis TaxID=261450 RepID=A0A835HYU1_9MAGN|nr:hypothetical protein IFM89_029501 [Coptis chinensis]
MAESGNYSHVVNFWMLHFQKMGLELKCSLCLNMLSKPMLLPCDHMFCSTCIPNLTELGSDCPICYRHYTDKDMRRPPYMENILGIYKSMEATLGTSFFQTSFLQSDITGLQKNGDQNQELNSSQLTQASPCSPPSFGETKDSDDDHSDRSGERSAKRSPAEVTVKKENEVGKRAKLCGRPNSAVEDQARNTKRQKLDFELQDMAPTSGINDQSNNLDAENKLEIPPFDAQPRTSYNLCEDPVFTCGFCQSSIVSEEDGLMLCPTHSLQKFPRERSTSEKKPGNNYHSTTKIAIQQPDKVWAASPGTTNEWVICGSSLSSAEKNFLAKFAKITGATVSKDWNPKVTHVIAQTDEKGAFSRTLKALMAILNGSWILKIDWIKACMEAMNPVNEEPYEVSIDVHGCQDGPKNGRERVMEKAPKLFNGLHIHLHGDFEQKYKGILEQLVEAAGGTLVTEDMLTSQSRDREAESSTRLVVYSLELPPEPQTDDLIFMKQRYEQAEKLANETRSWVLGHTWILESIAACKLQPFSCC